MFKYVDSKLVFYECEYCHKQFNRCIYKHNFYTKNNKSIGKFCSNRCKRYAQSLASGGNLPIELECKQCGNKFFRHVANIKQNKSNNLSCSIKCAALLKTGKPHVCKNSGIQKSKIEKYIQDNLIQKYSNLNIKLNDRSFGLELDIYIPELKVAFEINGPTHYKAIFGEETFKRMKNNDQRKIEMCKENCIQLFVVDVSNQKDYKHPEKFIEQITNMIEKI